MSEVVYRGIILARNSDAYKLWEDMKKDPKLQAKLDKHMKELDNKTKELYDRYQPKSAI